MLVIFHVCRKIPYFIWTILEKRYEFSKKQSRKTISRKVQLLASLLKIHRRFWGIDLDKPIWRHVGDSRSKFSKFSISEPAFSDYLKTTRSYFDDSGKTIAIFEEIKLRNISRTRNQRRKHFTAISKMYDKVSKLKKKWAFWRDCPKFHK